MKLVRTDGNDPGFIALVQQLNVELGQRNGTQDAFYAQFNGITELKYVMVAYKGCEPVGCGAIKELSASAMEVKRMFVPPANRGKGIANQVLLELEQWAYELGFPQCVLETGVVNIEAIALYKKNGYELIPNYGQYVGIDESVCFMKLLSE